MKLSSGTWVVVADGEKYLLLRNNLDEEFTDLRAIGKDEIDNPPAHELSSDRAGRMHDDGPGMKSAMLETDWHRIEKETFAHELAGKLEDWANAGRYDEIVVVADPRSLGELRSAYGAQTQARLKAEIDKDLTNMPIDAIEKAVAAA